MTGTREEDNEVSVRSRVCDTLGVIAVWTTKGYSSGMNWLWRGLINAGQSLLKHAHGNGVNKSLSGAKNGGLWENVQSNCVSISLL